MDKARDNLVDEVIIISKRIGWSGEYIERLPRLERMRALKIIEQMVQEEDKQIKENKLKLKK